MMKLKPQQIPLLPLSLLSSPDIEPEQQYLDCLKDSLANVLDSLQESAQQHGQRYVRRQQMQQMLEESEESMSELMHQNKCLQRENYELRVKVENYERGLKRYGINEQQLNNKIYHLNKLIAEKEAIIKYLQAKADSTPKYNIKPLPVNDTQDSFSKTFKGNNISFAKLKSSKSYKFEDFNSLSMQIDEEEPSFVKPFRGRVDRIKTESSTKENDKMQSLNSFSGVTKLNDFLNSRGKVDNKSVLMGSLQNQKTLTKSHTSQQGNLWPIPQKAKPQQVPVRRHSNLNSSKCLQLVSNEYLLRE